MGGGEEEKKRRRSQKRLGPIAEWGNSLHILYSPYTLTISTVHTFSATFIMNQLNTNCL
jgi:hypothetical protein